MTIVPTPIQTFPLLKCEHDDGDSEVEARTSSQQTWVLLPALPDLLSLGLNILPQYLENDIVELS